MVVWGTALRNLRKSLPLAARNRAQALLVALWHAGA
jgi:hypothetical protein